MTLRRFEMDKSRSDYDLGWEAYQDGEDFDEEKSELWKAGWKDAALLEEDLAEEEGEDSE
jgi:hypothetical protein